MESDKKKEHEKLMKESQLIFGINKSLCERNDISSENAIFSYFSLVCMLIKTSEAPIEEVKKLFDLALEDLIKHEKEKEKNNE